MMKICKWFVMGTLLLAGVALAAERSWIATWTASPQRMLTFNIPGAPPSPNAGLEDQTVRQRARISVGGKQVRVRLSNEFGTEPLTIGAASVALAGSQSSVDAASIKKLTFGGSASVVIPPGAPAVSDAVEFTVNDGQELAVSLYVPSKVELTTVHFTGQQTQYISSKGDFTAAAEMPVASSNAMRLYLSGVEVTGTRAKVLVAFGDSITDGAASKVDTNHRWPDYLYDRLQAKKMKVAIANQGISGNRVLGDGMGVSALARFDRDALSVPGVTHIIILEGINDIGAGGRVFGTGPAAPVVTANDIIAGYKQMIARAHGNGIKIYGGTLLPFEGTAGGYYTVEKEQVRQAVNEWIRTSNAFDAVIDFDAATRDPASPGKMLPAYDSGDHLHPGDAGYKAMAEVVDLKLLR
jgi:lysophospholipase L1-like esterase